MGWRERGGGEGDEGEWAEERGGGGVRGRGNVTGCEGADLKSVVGEGSTDEKSQRPEGKELEVRGQRCWGERE